MAFSGSDATCCRNVCKARPKFAIVITNEVFRCLSIQRGFSKLLGHPEIGRRSRDPDMDHPSRLQFDDEEGKEWPKEEISHWEKVTGPDLLGVRVYERAPRLTPWRLCANVPHVLLNGAFAT